MNKAERLELAALEAPLLRNASPKALARRITLVDKDDNVTGYTSGRELLKSLATVHDLTHAVEGRAKEVFCNHCGKIIPVNNRVGAVATVCREGCDRSCSVPGCTNEVGLQRAKRRALGNGPAFCRPCATKAAWTPEQRAQRSAAMREAKAAMSPERRRAAARKGHEAMMASTTHAQRSSAIRAGMRAKP